MYNLAVILPGQSNNSLCRKVSFDALIRKQTIQCIEDDFFVYNRTIVRIILKNIPGDVDAGAMSSLLLGACL